MQRRLIGVLALVILALSGSVFHSDQALAATATDCTANPPTYGCVVSSVTIPAGTATANYRVWTRMATDDSAHSSYNLEVLGTATSSFTIGSSTTKTVPVYSTTDDANGTRFKNDSSNWINTTAGSGAGSVVSVSLPAGTTTIQLIGNSPGVVIDRVIFTQDTSCVPTGTGDNCASPADTTAPSGSITSPIANNQVTSPAISVSASDNVGVTGVDIYDTVTVGSSTTTTKLGSATLSGSPTACGNNECSTWQYAWNTSALAAGTTHTLTARITDGTNPVVTTAAVPVKIKDNSAPTAVNITAPAASTTQSGDFTATASASDNVGVSKVEFYVSGPGLAAGGVLNQTVTTSPYTKLITTSGLTAGSVYTLTAKAYDVAGNATSSSGVSFTYTPTTSAAAPAVSISNVLTTSIISTDLTIATGATNAQLNSSSFIVNVVPTDKSGTGIKNVSLKLDDTAPIIMTSGFNFPVNMKLLGCGSHTLTAIVTDNQASPKSSSVSVTFKATRGVDINANCTTDLSDYNGVRSGFGLTAAELLTKQLNPRLDVNRNGTVDLSDYSAVRTKFGG